MGVINRLSGYDLAIDLGTQSTQIYAAGRGIMLSEPSLAAVEGEGRRVIGAGWAASRLLRDEPAGLEAVWPLANGVVADFETAERMLAHFIRKARRRACTSFLRPPMKPRALVCVPAGATNLELSSLGRTVSAAGVRAVNTIEGPLAAAIGAGLPIYQSRGTMVVDIGSGKTEAAVLCMGEIVAGTSIRCGGAAIDEAIRSYCRREHIFLVDAREAERLKIELGSALPIGEEEEFEVADGVDLLSGSSKTILLSSTEIYRAIRGSVQSVVEVVRKTFESTPVELFTDIVEGGLVLCGGGTRLRLLADLLRYKIGVPVSVAREPHKCAAVGAGLVLEREGSRPENPAFGELHSATHGVNWPSALQPARD